MKKKDDKLIGFYSLECYNAILVSVESLVENVSVFMT